MNDPDAREALKKWIRTNSFTAMCDRIELAEHGLHEAKREAISDQSRKDLARYIKSYSELSKKHEFLQNSYKNQSERTETIVAYNQKLRRQIGQLKAKRFQRK